MASGLKDTDASADVRELLEQLVRQYGKLAAPADALADETAATLALTAGATQTASGVYRPALVPVGIGEGGDEGALNGSADFAAALMDEEVRIDVDGDFPLNVVSGRVKLSVASRVDWIARLQPAGPRTWTGSIFYKNGDIGAFPFTQVKLQQTGGGPIIPHSAILTFSGGAAPDRRRTFRQVSPFFHDVEFEYDRVQGITPTLQIQTHAHPNHPATLPSENLSIRTVYQRAGFDVRISPGASTIPIAGAGGNALWSDQEMHDAMQTFWSRFQNKPQFAMWVFFAARHEQGENLGGIMFDDIGPNHRQGTAIFNDSFISVSPGGDVAPQAWVERMRFWTACHEMGHAFNLAHSWQKSLVVGGAGPWVPLVDEDEARSFMNYPFRVTGGQTAFFSDFRYGFSQSELLFMRHAPSQFVEMGNANWFHDHGFENAHVSAEPTLKLEVRVHRNSNLFEYMEPVVTELKLTNLTDHPLLVDRNILDASEGMLAVIKRERDPARHYLPFASYCRRPEPEVLQPGESKYESLFVSVGRAGWDISEPGRYQIQVALEYENEDIVSNPLEIRVAPPRLRYEEELLAQDVFSADVGRVLAFDGSRVLQNANGVLREVVERLPESRAALHSRIALGAAAAQAFKMLRFDADDLAGAQIQLKSPDEKMAKEMLGPALKNAGDREAESLSHIDLKYYSERYSDFLKGIGDTNEAVEVLNALHSTLASRDVLPSVLGGIEARRELAASEKSPSSHRGKKAR